MAYVLAITKWAEFQHYKDRDPPWVKLYRDTLTSEVWTSGSNLSRLLQVASTMLAARYRNKIPANFEHLKKVCAIDCDEAEFLAALDHLIAHNFLEIQEVEDAQPRSASELLASCATTSKVLYSEERRGEKRRSDQNPVGLASDEVPHGTQDAIESIGQNVAMVFRHWCNTWNHPRAALDAKRRRLIRNALALYTPQQLIDCISGYRNSPHHMGQNEQATVYDSIELFLRDAGHIDKGIALNAAPPETAEQRQAREAEARRAKQTVDAWELQKARAARMGFREPLDGETVDQYREAISARVSEIEQARRFGGPVGARTA